MYVEVMPCGDGSDILKLFHGLMQLEEGEQSIEFNHFIHYRLLEKLIICPRSK